MTDTTKESTEKKDVKVDVAEIEGKKEGGEDEQEGVKKIKKKLKRAVPHAHAYVFATYNNTLITITDPSGDVISWSSAGSSNFKGARKATPYAAQVAAENAVDKATLYGVETINIYIKGVGAGREQAIRGIHGKGIDIQSIIDTTPVPHNGCRKKKVRRV